MTDTIQLSKDDFSLLVELSAMSITALKNRETEDAYSLIHDGLGDIDPDIEYEDQLEQMESELNNFINKVSPQFKTIYLNSLK